MNALTLLNNFEREFARPFFRAPTHEIWVNDLFENRTGSFNSEMTYDEKNLAWKLTIELAGVTKENVKMDTTDDFILLTGEKTKGLSLGKFEGKYKLPENVDIEKIEATFEDGVLTVAMPLIAKKTAKTIEIK